MKTATAYSYEDFINTIDNFQESYSRDIDEQKYFGFPINAILEAEIKLTSVINYVEIYAECSKHGLWRKVYRFS